MSTETIETPVTKLLAIKYPIILAGMNKAAGPKLAAAVTNAGGLGVIGGQGFTPRTLKLTIKHLKRNLIDKSAPFGVDLLLPKVGGSARKTNYDYTKGKLNELIDIIIESGAKLFVCAVGVPPVVIVNKLHKHNILVMNMVGAPKHVSKAISVGVDMICAQGGEGGGHTGSIATTVLLPKVVDICSKHKSPLTGQPIIVVGAGGIYDGRGLAAALSYGASAVWVGTRFVASIEAGASLTNKEEIVKSGPNDTIRTLIYTGRPLRILKNPYCMSWENNSRQQEMKKLLKKGILPYTIDNINYESNIPNLSGQIAANIYDILPAKTIVQNMMKVALQMIKRNSARITILHSKL